MRTSLHRSCRCGSSHDSYRDGCGLVSIASANGRACRWRNASLVSAGIIPRPRWTNAWSTRVNMMGGRRRVHPVASARRLLGQRRTYRSLAPLRQPASARGVRRCSACSGSKRRLHLHIPICLPPGLAVSRSVALISKGNLWVFQRANAGKPQLRKSTRTTSLPPSDRRRRDRLPGQGRTAWLSMPRTITDLTARTARP